jgi:hypothetical protein
MRQLPIRLLFCICLLLPGCDRLREATVAGRAALQHDSPCGVISVSAQHFIERHYFLKIENRSLAPLEFRVRNLRARQGAQLLNYEVHYEGQFTPAKTLRIENGDAFSYDIQSGPLPIVVSADELYAKDTIVCSLDALQLEVPAPN